VNFYIHDEFFPPATNHITIHASTFGLFLKRFSTYIRKKAFTGQESFGLFQVNVTGIKVNLVVIALLKLTFYFFTTKPAWTRISKIVFNVIRRVKCKSLATLYVIILKECMDKPSLFALKCPQSDPRN